MTYVGWSMKEYDDFFELRTKANEWNLQEAKRLLDMEIEARARRLIVDSFEGGLQ